MATDLDPALVWDAAPGPARAFVTQFLERQGLDACDWVHVPPVRQILEFAAVQEFAAAMPEFSETTAYRMAAELLGLQDNCDRDTEYHPADRYRRTRNEWKHAVREAREKFSRHAS